MDQPRSADARDADAQVIAARSDEASDDCSDTPGVNMVTVDNPAVVFVEASDGCTDELGAGAVGCDTPVVVRQAEARSAPDIGLICLLCLVGGIEGADYVLLPSVFFALQVDLGLALSDVSVMAMVQALAGNVAAPMWGALADRGNLRRKTIIVFGCVVQGCITIMLAGVDAFVPMVMLRALNGMMLASLRPIANGIVADVTSELNRGKVYGAMNVALNLGTMAGTFIGVNLSRKTVIGWQGWRVAFLLIGGFSVLIGAVAGVLMREPPRASPAVGKGRGLAAIKAEMRELLGYFRLPSFCVLIMQGVFGSVPWSALGYKTLFFQLNKISDFEASLIDVFSQIAGSAGAFLGGAIGDCMTRCSRNHGRPLTAQISVLAGMPVAWFVFAAEPPTEDHAFAYYLCLMVTLGLFATWCGVGVNLPILSEIVRDDRRATIMAWEGTLEGTCAIVAGNALVGFLAEHVFHYEGMANAKNAKDFQNNNGNAKALGSALLMVSVVPWCICFACYSLLHWAYPHDLRRLQNSRARQTADVGALEARKLEVPSGARASEENIAK
mmetsp:Transcript_59284/g.171296  ORF Transcript_59284/g.171296 Transcript_59284/m.171296 type:complete len:555 (-) Transcript_59284:88-1752(-)